jgi:hypothetical protein
MGRLIAIILGGAALALFVPLLVPGPLESVNTLWEGLLGEWYPRIVGPSLERIVEGEKVIIRPGAGAGIFAGLALVLLAVRGKE